MTNRLVALTTIALLVSPSVARAQSAISGKWDGKTPNGFQLQLDLAATEHELKGTFSRDGHLLAITDGKVSKNNFSFKVAMNGEPQGFSGVIDGDRIKIWMDRQGPAMAAVMKRTVDATSEAGARLTGKWQGATATGRPLVLDIKVAGGTLTGRLILDDRPVDITNGKAEGETFSFRARTVDGPVAAEGRRVGEDVELTVEGIGKPLTLKSVK